MNEKTAWYPGHRKTAARKETKVLFDTIESMMPGSKDKIRAAYRAQDPNMSLATVLRYLQPGKTRRDLTEIRWSDADDLLLSRRFGNVADWDGLPITELPDEQLRLLRSTGRRAHDTAQGASIYDEGLGGYRKALPAEDLGQSRAIVHATDARHEAYPDSLTLPERSSDIARRRARRGMQREGQSDLSGWRKAKGLDLVDEAPARAPAQAEIPQSTPAPSASSAQGPASRATPFAPSNAPAAAPAAEQGGMIPPWLAAAGIGIPLLGAGAAGGYGIYNQWND